MKIGIMGGTFNPVHLAHLMLAERAREEFSLERVLFMPSGQPAYKKEIAILPAEIRMELLRLAIQGNPYFEVSDLELRRTGDTYTADTVLELKQLRGQDDLYFIIGGDSLMYLDKWNRPEVIFANMHILAAARPGAKQDALEKKADDLKKTFGADIALFAMPQMDISSTEIRKRLKENKSIRYLVPKAVEEYLLQGGFSL